MAAERRASRRIRTRITLVVTAVVAIVLGLGAWGIVSLLAQNLTSGVATRLESELASIADGLEGGLVPAAWIAERDDDSLIAWRTTAADETTVVVNADDALALPDTVEGSPVRTVIDGESYLMVGEALDEGTLLLGASLAEVDAAVAETGTLLALAVPLAVAVVGLVVWAVAAQALSPVDRIRRQVDAIDADALDHRVAVRGTGDEVDLLAATMNRMLSRIEESYAAQQRFAGDASHELRSPLATMRQYAELAEAHPGATSTAEIADVVREQGARMQETLEGLLLLARLDERAVRASDAIDLDDLARAQVARLAGEGLVVDARSVEPVRLRGDARLLRRAVENLVDNARRHARDRIAVGVRAVDGTALVWVDDDGPGIPESERSRVFDRFVRLDEGRSRDAGGSGLGLAIVLEIVRVHGGSVRIDTAPLGGARVVIELPIRDS